jgi:hypothetical protein
MLNDVEVGVEWSCPRVGHVRATLTFSKPKNLSLPSSRNGPAFCSIFSRGVTSKIISSFFFASASLAGWFGEALREAFCQQRRLCTRLGRWTSQREARQREREEERRERD